LQFVIDCQEKNVYDFSMTWNLVSQSFRLLRNDKKLMVFPILSAVGAAALALPFLLALFGMRLANGLHWGPNTWLVMFLWYCGASFITIFFNCALAACVQLRFAGQNPTLGGRSALGLRRGHDGRGAAAAVRRESTQRTASGVGVFTHIDSWAPPDDTTVAASALVPWPVDSVHFGTEGAIESYRENASPEHDLPSLRVAMVGVAPAVRALTRLAALPLRSLPARCD
jgi:hypothetical protein